MVKLFLVFSLATLLCSLTLFLSNKDQFKYTYYKSRRSAIGGPERYYLDFLDSSGESHSMLSGAYKGHPECIRAPIRGISSHIRDTLPDSLQELSQCVQLGKNYYPLIIEFKEFDRPIKPGGSYILPFHAYFADVFDSRLLERGLIYAIPTDDLDQIDYDFAAYECEILLKSIPIAFNDYGGVISKKNFFLRDRGVVESYILFTVKKGYRDSAFIESEVTIYDRNGEALAWDESVSLGFRISPTFISQASFWTVFGSVICVLLSFLLTQTHNKSQKGKHCKRNSRPILKSDGTAYR